MSNGLKVRVDDFTELACQRVMIEYDGKRYRITGNHEGLRVLAADGRLVIRPNTANVITLSQISGLITEDFRVVPEEEDGL